MATSSQGLEEPGCNPVLVEVLRGGAVESRHRGAAAVATADGTLMAAWGDTERPVFSRSAIKPLQVLPLIESGAADRFDVSDREIAVACASHSGERRHVDTVSAWLQRMGIAAERLECGAHPPFDPAAAAALERADKGPSALHNNCSGKHAGMLATAAHMGEPLAGYIAVDHPVQRRIAALLGDLTGEDVARASLGFDGCGVPNWALSLSGLARAFARFAKADGLGTGRDAACRRVQRAMAAHPLQTAGSGRLCSVVIARSGGKALIKTGAEAVFAGALPARGIGVALKIDDGAKRASEVVVCALLRALGVLDDAAWQTLEPFAQPVLRNWSGREVGAIRVRPGWPVMKGKGSR